MARSLLGRIGLALFTAMPSPEKSSTYLPTTFFRCLNRPDQTQGGLVDRLVDIVALTPALDALQTSMRAHILCTDMASIALFKKARPPCARAQTSARLLPQSAAGISLPQRFMPPQY